MDRIHRLACGNGNCYIIENGTNGVLVDTGKREFVGRVAEACERFNVTLLVLTHAHFDHAENAAVLSDRLGIPIAMAEADRSLIASNAAQQLYAATLPGKIVLSASLKEFSARPMDAFRPDIWLEEGDDLLEYGINGKILALPGHTDGSIGLDVGGKDLIVGDALMNMFHHPAVSLLYHDREQMLESARRIGELGERTVYFGHGKPKKNRQWVK